MDRPAVSFQFLRFALVGTAGFIVDASILTLLVNGLLWNHYTARAVSFAAAVTVTWYCNRRWVFEATANAGKEYGGYVAVQCLGAAINLATYVGLIESMPALRRVPAVPLAVGSLLALAANFFASRRFVFDRSLRNRVRR
jgi:putative flippase GtrA